MARRSARSLSALAAISNEELQRAWQDLCAGMDSMEFLAYAAESDVCRDLNLRRQFKIKLLDGNGAVAESYPFAPAKVRVDKD